MQAVDLAHAVYSVDGNAASADDGNVAGANGHGNDESAGNTMTEVIGENER